MHTKMTITGLWKMLNWTFLLHMLKPFNNKLNEHVCRINSSLPRVTDGELLNASQFRKS